MVNRNQNFSHSNSLIAIQAWGSFIVISRNVSKYHQKTTGFLKCIAMSTSFYRCLICVFCLMVEALLLSVVGFFWDCFSLHSCTAFFVSSWITLLNNNNLFHLGNSWTLPRNGKTSEHTAVHNSKRRI